MSPMIPSVQPDDPIGSIPRAPSGQMAAAKKLHGRVGSTMGLLLVVLASFAAAGAADPVLVHLDLSGPWRWTASDDPKFAAPDFDDSSWSIERLPRLAATPLVRLHAGAPEGFVWYRRAIDLPLHARGQSLSLTIGAIREGYQVFVNGRLAADTGPFSAPELKIARPRVFDLPPLGDASRAVIALRVWDISLRSTQAWNIRDTGPWLLSSAALAPRQAGVAAIERQRLRRLGDFANPLLALSLAAVILLVWFNARGQRELLWLGFFLVATSAGRLIRFVEITPEAQPFGWPAHFLILVGRVLPPALQAQFIASTFGLRWVSRSAWTLAVACGVLGEALPFEKQYFGFAFHLFPGEQLVGFTNVAIALVAFSGLGQAVLRRRDRHEAWQGAGRYVLVVGAALAVVSQLLNLTSLAPVLTPLLGASPETYMTPLVAVAMTMVIVRRLLRDRDEKLRLAGELEAARGIQQLLLPSAETRTQQYATEAAYRPASEVGGDFYWTRAQPDGGLLVVAGDVSGKGLRAAMLVSVAVGILRNEKSSSPAAILGALNHGLAGRTGGGFVTACCALFEVRGGATIASAGHPSPYADGHEAQVEAGLPLGITAEAVYRESRITGEYFTFVSDGVVEAENPQRELFGFDRTREISTKPAQEIAEAAKAWGQNDDITVVTVRRRSA